jgi:hypothetical protein
MVGYYIEVREYANGKVSIWPLAFPSVEGAFRTVNAEAGCEVWMNKQLKHEQRQLSKIEISGSVLVGVAAGPRGRFCLWKATQHVQ